MQRLGPVQTLVLVQDFNFLDEKPTSFKNASTFSVLTSLIYNTRKYIDETFLGDMMPKLPKNNPHIVFGTDSHPTSLYEHQNVRDHIGEFANIPVELLQSWNCKVVSERRIKVVYKVREWSREEANSWQKTSVFGYPIWIFAST